MRRKKLVTVTLSQEVLDWIDKQIKNRTFASRSHAIDYIVAKFMEEKVKE
ncbi:MAG: ribbon-helix-helix domain-containing protein [Candidatus Aenigmarchaeota archaeon]|nr:ribbon-helix-helix domain-containing protein [Candidatus Aenigmarchaeota archaeon]